MESAFLIYVAEKNIDTINSFLKVFLKLSSSLNFALSHILGIPLIALGQF